LLCMRGKNTFEFPSSSWTPLPVRPLLVGFSAKTKKM